jgi:hypothetical protein
MAAIDTQERADREKEKLTPVFSNADLDEANLIAGLLERQRKMDERARVEFYPKIFLQYFDEYGESQDEVSWSPKRERVLDVEYTISGDYHGEGYLFLGKGAHGGDDVD